MVRINIFNIAPQEYKALVWDIFFTSRNRGLTLNQHFPWIDIPHRSTWYAIAISDDGIIGGLAVREDENSSERIASIGLVCVSPAHQQNGISSLLLGLAIEEARSRGIAALRLWTTKPNVYIRHGFAMADTALFGWINKPTGAMGTKILIPSSENSFSKNPEKTCFGLPPFALHRHHWESENATLITVDDVTGTIVAEWSGQAQNVARLIENVIPKRARFNAIVKDTLPNELKSMGWLCELKPQQLQMICPLIGQTSPQEWAELYPVRFLNRI